MKRLVLLPVLTVVVGATIGGVAAGTEDPPVSAAATLSGVAEVSAGWDFACARMSNGTARCWGRGYDGRLGNGSTADRTHPTTVKNPAGTGALTNVIQIVAGDQTACALMADRTARCWGENGAGQLGDGTTTNRSLPRTVKNPSGSGALTNIAAIYSDSGAHTCARLLNGTARCWGNNNYGELGDGSAVDSSLPVTVRATSGSGSLQGVVEMTVGYVSTCARLANHQVRCWGDNSSGELGTGNTTGSIIPKVVKNSSNTGALTSVVQISGGYYHTCALLTNGQVRCWGGNDDGVLGDGTTTYRTLPRTVKSTNGMGALMGVTSIGMGGYESCATIAGGQARCWGLGDSGELGSGTMPAAQKVPRNVKNEAGTANLTGVARVVSGSYFACTRMTNSTVRCFGYNGYGQLGNGTTTDSSLPVVVG